MKYRNQASKAFFVTTVFITKPCSFLKPRTALTSIQSKILCPFQIFNSSLSTEQAFQLR